jgi:serine/threonine protein kinase
MMAIQAITGAEPRLFGEHPETAELVWRDRLQGNYSPQFLDILDKMVRYDFRQRYQTASEVLMAIASMPNITEHDLPTVVSASNMTNNAATIITSSQDATQAAGSQGDSSYRNSHTVAFQESSSRKSFPIWVWVTGGFALLLVVIMAIISKTAKNAPEVVNNPVAPNLPSPTATPPKVTPSPTTAPTPLSVEELLAQALILNRNDKPQEALAKVEEAIKLDPTNADAWGAKGLLLRSMGRENEAIASFSKALELSPDERLIPPSKRELPSKKGGKKKDDD